jgi:hypothetical protein
MKNKSRGIFLLIVVLSLIVSGCADFQKKFIRKKKEYDGPPRYYAVREYDIRPSIELYEKRYIYWKNWHRELLSDINDANRKKVGTDIEQVISNLWDMKKMLVDEKGDKLQEDIDQMVELEEVIKKQSITMANRVKLRRKLELLMREIKRDFSYRKMGGYIRNEFRREQQD